MFAIQCYEWKTSFSAEKIRGFVGFGSFDLPEPVRKMSYEEALHECENWRSIHIHLGFRPVSV